MMKRKISILGCGWLGLPLAKNLLDLGFSVKGSTTSGHKISVLENAGIEAFQISLSENGITGDIENFFKSSEILIIDIPPKLRGENSENFVSKILILIPFIESARIEKVLFVSSTAVYADDNSTVTENTIPNPDGSGKQLLDAERLLQSNAHFQATILRFGGLVGAGRHPVQFLAGKTGLENPDAPINLIHQKDCIGIILKIIETDSWNDVFNAATPFHPTRAEYYTAKAKALGLPLPTFDHTRKSVGKTIDPKKITQMLGYPFSELP